MWSTCLPLCRSAECHAPGIFRPSHTFAFSLLYPLYLKTLHFHKSRDNERTKAKITVVLMIQETRYYCYKTDYRSNHRCSHPSPKHRPGPRNRQFLRRVHILLLPSTTRRTDEPDNHLQASPAPQSAAVRRQRLPCLWVGDLEPERQHGKDG